MQRTDPPVVRSLTAHRFRGIAHRAADDEPIRHDPSRTIGGQVVGTEVYAGRTGRESDIESVVDQDRHRQRPDQLSGNLEQLGVTHRLEPQLDRRHAALDRRLAGGDQRPETDQTIVGDQQQSQGSR